MDEKRPMQESDAEPRAGREYAAPQLTRLGSLLELTREGGNEAPDALEGSTQATFFMQQSYLR